LRTSRNDKNINNVVLLMTVLAMTVLAMTVLAMTVLV